MLTVLVANTKGGCGKTTIATNLAAACAGGGLATVLADADRQRSSLAWAERRPPNLPMIVALDWARGVGAVPAKTARLIIDAPAALKTKEVEELLALADLVVLPVLPSAFDETATRRFVARLDELKPVRRSRIGVAIVGNRVRARSRAAERLDEFLAELGHKVVTRLRDSALYAETAASGSSLFDLPVWRSRDAREDWTPLLTWIEASRR